MANFRLTGEQSHHQGTGWWEGLRKGGGGGVGREAPVKATELFQLSLIRKISLSAFFLFWRKTRSYGKVEPFFVSYYSGRKPRLGGEPQSTRLENGMTGSIQLCPIMRHHRSCFGMSRKSGYALRGLPAGGVEGGGTHGSFQPLPSRGWRGVRFCPRLSAGRVESLAVCASGSPRGHR